MDLHELMGTVVADLPDLPDQLDEVGRIHRRRSSVKRATMVAAGTALVLGAGTLTIAAPWTGAAVNTATVRSGPITKLQFAQDAARILQNSWPAQGERVAWAPGAFPRDGNEQYLIFTVEEGAQMWQLDVVLYGLSATTPYPLVDAVPSACVMAPQDCAANSDGSLHAYAVGDGMGLAYVFTGQNLIYTIATMPTNPPATTSHPGSATTLTSTGSLTNWSPAGAGATSLVETRPLTDAQFEQLGLSDGMRQVYAEAAEAGLLVGGISSTATPIPSEYPPSS
jgi:hypothetical protein